MTRTVGAAARAVYGIKARPAVGTSARLVAGTKAVHAERRIRAPAIIDSFEAGSSSRSFLTSRGATAMPDSDARFAETARGFEPAGIQFTCAPDASLTFCLSLRPWVGRQRARSR